MSLVLRKGTWLCFVAIAVMTPRRHESDLLMFCARHPREHSRQHTNRHAQPHAAAFP